MLESHGHGWRVVATGTPQNRRKGLAGSTLVAMGSPVLLTSPLLTSCGIPHAFTTRLGGFSTGIFDSLNFGNPSDLPAERRDPVASIALNKDAALRAVGMAGREFVEVHQVHGDGVHVVRAGRPSHAGPETTKADAIVSDDGARAVAVRVADCTPVLLATNDGRLVAAVHAGWRGVVADVACRTVEAMRALGARPEELVAAIGPCISEPEFEIGPEVIEAFRRRFGQDTPHARAMPDGKGRADMQGALRTSLEGAGVGRIDTLARCTVREPTHFFSHRRDRGVTGRMAAFIGAVASPR